MNNKPFDLIDFGGTGFTGRLVAEYLNNTYGTGGPVAGLWPGAARTRLASCAA